MKARMGHVIQITLAESINMINEDDDDRLNIALALLDVRTNPLSSG